MRPFHPAPKSKMVQRITYRRRCVTAPRPSPPASRVRRRVASDASGARTARATTGMRVRRGKTLESSRIAFGRRDAAPRDRARGRPATRERAYHARAPTHAVERRVRRPLAGRRA